MVELPREEARGRGWMVVKQRYAQNCGKRSLQLCKQQRNMEVKDKESTAAFDLDQ
jgi:hypothetical protein